MVLDFVCSDLSIRINGSMIPYIVFRNEMLSPGILDQNILGKACAQSAANFRKFSTCLALSASADQVLLQKQSSPQHALGQPKQVASCFGTMWHTCLLELGLQISTCDLLIMLSLVQSVHWTQHEWMIKEVMLGVEKLAKVSCSQRAQELAKDCSISGEAPEEPLSCFLKITSHAVPLRARPELAAPVVEEAGLDQVLGVKARRGLWLRIPRLGVDAWLLCFQGRKAIASVLQWEVVVPP